VHGGGAGPVSVVTRCPGSTAVSFTETARDEQRTPDFIPSRFRKTAHNWTNSIPLRERHVIEIQRTFGWHPITRRQDDLGRQSSNRSRRRYYDDFVQVVDDFTSCENQNWPSLVGKPK
jgi:hypothetical protein